MCNRYHIHNTTLKIKDIHIKMTEFLVPHGYDLVVGCRPGRKTEHLDV